jgi:hypothetical protein
MIVIGEQHVGAISFGVFCRVAPSTRPMIRSRKDSRIDADPDHDMIRQDLRPARDRERSPPLADHRGGFARDRRLVHGRDPSITSPSPGMVWPGSR